MANNVSEVKFNFARNAGMPLLHSMSPHIEEQFSMWSDERDTYALNKKLATKGTQRRRGSSSSEQNHSSALSHLNDGICSENTYCENPATLLQDLFHRQKYHVNKWNDHLAADCMEIDTHISKLEIGESIPMANVLLNAAKVLNKRSYERFKKECCRAFSCLQIFEEPDLEGNNIYCISTIQSASADPRRFITKTQMCTCPCAVAHKSQCAHEVKLHCSFMLSLFYLRHHCRESVQDGWTRNTTAMINEEVANEDIFQNGTLHSDFTLHEDFLLNPNMDHNKFEIVCKEGVEPMIDNTAHVNSITNLMQQAGTGNSSLKPLSCNDMMKLFNEITSNYDKCSECKKIIMSGIAVNLSKLSMTEGQDECGNDLNSVPGNIEEITNLSAKYIQQYKSTFALKHMRFSSQTNTRRKCQYSMQRHLFKTIMYKT